jgi:hypothetical protein
VQNVTHPHHSSEEIARAYLGEPVKRARAELFWHDPHYPDQHPSIQVNTRNGKWGNFARNVGGESGWSLAAYLADASPDDKPAVCRSMAEHGLLEPAKSFEQKLTAAYHWGRDQNGVEVRRIRLEPGRDGRTKDYKKQHRLQGEKWKFCSNCNHRWKLYRNDCNGVDYILGVEGEGKVDLAKELELPAFCHKDLTPEQAAELKGFEIILWPDKDSEGTRSVNAAARVLQQAGVKSISVIVPPEELPDKGDIIDYVKLGRGRFEVGKLVALAEPWEEKQEIEPLEPQQTTVIKAWQEIPDLLAMPPEKVEWTVQGILPRQSLTLITGLPSHYKSWLALALLRGVALSGTFLGRVCQKGPVLYLDRENPRAVVQNRLAILGIEYPDNWKIWGRWLKDAPPMIGDPRLLEIAKELQPLIIFDSLIRFHGADENSAKDMAQVIEGLRMLVDAGATVATLHHKGRAEGSQYRGSSDIIGGPDTAYSVSRDREAGTLRLDCFKSRYIEEFSLTIRPDLNDSGDFLVVDAPEVTVQHENVAHLAEIIRENAGINQTKLIEKSGMPQARVRAILQQYAGEFWEVRNGGHNHKSYFLMVEGVN